MYYNEYSSANFWWYSIIGYTQIRTHMKSIHLCQVQYLPFHSIHYWNFSGPNKWKYSGKEP